MSLNSTTSWLVSITFCHSNTWCNSVRTKHQNHRWSDAPTSQTPQWSMISVLWSISTIWTHTNTPAYTHTHTHTHTLSKRDNTLAARAQICCALGLYFPDQSESSNPCYGEKKMRQTFSVGHSAGQCTGTEAVAFFRLGQFTTWISSQLPVKKMLAFYVSAIHRYVAWWCFCIQSEQVAHFTERRLLKVMSN